jgi:Ring finger domain
MQSKIRDLVAASLRACCRFHQSLNSKLWSPTATAISVTFIKIYANRIQLIYLIQGGSSWSPLPDAASQLSSSELAVLLQLQYDEETRILTAERAGLAAAAQPLFDCGVCMDTLQEESIARIEPCGHPFCRDCVRGFIVSQIESHRFPALCPTCTAEQGNNSESIGSMCELYW